MSIKGNPWKNAPGMIVAWLKNFIRLWCEDVSEEQAISRRLKRYCRRRKPLDQYAQDWIKAWEDLLAGR